MRFAKYKGPEISRIEAHNERTKETYASNPDIDRGRTHLNFNLVEPPQHYRAEAEKQIAQAGCRVRSDSIRLVEVLFTVSTGYFDGKSDVEIRKYYEHSLNFLKEHQRQDTIVSAVVHMDEGTPHMHVTFVPLTEDNRLSAKDILGNRKKMIQWQDLYYDHMVKAFPDLSRGESAEQTGRKHMDVQAFKAFTKEIRKMEKIADKVGTLLDGVGLLNAKGRLEELVPLVQDLLVRFGKMKTRMKQITGDFLSLKQENEKLKKDNEALQKDNDALGKACQLAEKQEIQSESELKRMQSAYRKLEKTIGQIPEEILAAYCGKTDELVKPRQER